MALSVLKIGSGYANYGLYDSKRKSFVLKGEQEDLYKWKHLIEEVQQQKDNEEYLKGLREEYIGLLTAPGSNNTLEQATDFLTRQMPFLFV